MKKKTRGTAPGAPKRRKSGVVEPKGGSQGARRVKVPSGSAPRPSVTPNGAKLAIRRLKVQLAQAQARIEELEAMVAALLRHVRSSDVIGRLGGDEFALLLWNLSETDAKAKAAALEQAVDRLSFVFRGRPVTAGASAGVAILGLHAEAGRALEEADSAMYVRKAQRRHEA